MNSNHPGSPYVVVLCSFNERHEATFLKCMADLERKIVITGFEGYGDACKAAFGGVLGIESRKKDPIASLGVLC